MNCKYNGNGGLWCEGLVKAMNGAGGKGEEEATVGLCWDRHTGNKDLIPPCLPTDTLYIYLTPCS